jgi:hypothetical protein
MTVTVVAGLILSPSVSLLAAHLPHRTGVQADRLEQADARFRRHLLQGGWRSTRGGSMGDEMAARIDSIRVEFVAASRPFQIHLAGGIVTGQPARLAQLRATARVLAQELGRYPPSFLPAVRLRRVMLCTDLREGSVRIPSLPNYERSLLLDVDSPPSFVRRLVHHEIFHFADFADDGQLQRDPQWEALNGPRFSYGSGGRFMRSPGSALLTDALPGFLTRYSTSALEEDKAEVFAFSMTAPAAVARVAARDSVVRAKVHAVRAQVARLDPAMGAEFWDRIAGSP